MAKDIQYRILPANEWDKLEAIMDKTFIPVPDSATCAVAEDESGNITGAVFLQLAVHMEPLIITTPKVSFKRLFEAIMDAVKEDKGLHFYAFTDQEIIGKIAEHVGMKEMPLKVYEGEVV